MEKESNNNNSLDCAEKLGLSDAAVVKSLDGQYFMIDVCANLTNKKFARDLDGVIQRAKDAGVKKIIILSTNTQSSKDALRLTRLFPDDIYCTAGIHPHDAKLWNEETLDDLKNIISNSECVAVGQCGLDFSKTFSEPSQQKTVFEKLVALACDVNKPIVVYERDAQEEVLEVLTRMKDRLPAIVVHSFAGNKEQLQRYLSIGCYIGVTGYIWKDKSENGLKQILEDRLIPLDRLLVETDSPFMYPNTRASQIPAHIKNTLTEKSLSFLHRYCTFQRNEPCSLPVIVELIAAYYDIRPDEVALKVTYSTLKVFGLC